MMSVRPATCRCPTFSAVVLMLSTMLFKGRKQLSSSFQVWGSVYFCWFGVSLQVSNCIASGIVPQKKIAGGILVFTYRLICFLYLSFVCTLKTDMGKRMGKKACTVISCTPSNYLHACTHVCRCVRLCVCVREKGEKERERRRGKRKRRGRARKEEGERERGRGGRERER